MHRFDEDIANHPLEAQLTLGVRVAPNWSINGLPNGGYLMALMANAMLRASEKKTIAIVSTTFISRCDPAEGRVRLEQIAVSSQFERVAARLYQGRARTAPIVGHLYPRRYGVRAPSPGSARHRPWRP